MFVIKTLSSVLLAASLLAAPVSAGAHAVNPVAAPVVSGQEARATHNKVDRMIAQAKQADPGAFANRRALIASSKAFVAVLDASTKDAERALDLFAASATDAQAQALVDNTKGKHYVIAGTEENPNVYLADGEPSPTPSLAGMPRCARAWAAFAAWLAGTTLLCAPFSGPAAWACALGAGLLGLMPDFNRAC